MNVEELAFKILHAIAHDINKEDGWSSCAELHNSQEAPNGLLEVTGYIDIHRIARVAATAAAEHAAATPDTTDPFTTLEQFAQFTATISGAKKQLTDQGWTDSSAEAVVMNVLFSRHAS